MYTESLSRSSAKSASVTSATLSALQNAMGVLSWQSPTKTLERGSRTASRLQRCSGPQENSPSTQEASVITSGQHSIFTDLTSGKKWFPSVLAIELEDVQLRARPLLWGQREKQAESTFIGIICVTAVTERTKHNVPARMCNENTREVCLKTQPLSICNYWCIKKQKFPKEKTARGQTGHRSAGGEQLHCASLALDVLLLLLSSLFLFLFHFINLSLSQHTSFYFFSLPSHWEGVANSRAVLSCLPG